MSAQTEDFRAVCRIPDAHGPIPAGGSEPPAVGTIRHPQNGIEMPGQRENLHAAWWCPGRTRMDRWRSPTFGRPARIAISAALPNLPVKATAFGAAVASQSFTVPSPPPAASRQPSGLNATLETVSLWPCKTRASFPAVTSQTFTILLPGRRREPPAVWAECQTGDSFVIVKCLNLASVVSVPDLGSIVAARRERSAVRAVCQATERCRVLAHTE